MALRLTGSHFRDTESSSDPEYDYDRSGQSSSEDEEDEADLNWDDWVSDSADQRPCKSLFEDKTLSSVSDVLNHDKTPHGFDLEGAFSRLCTLLGHSASILGY